MQAEALAERSTDTLATHAPGWRRLRRDPSFLIPALGIVLLTTIAIAPELWGAGDPFDCSLDRSLVRPSWGHPFGFDLQGCDYYTRVLHGARSSLAVAALVVAFISVISVIIGSLIGFKRGILDSIVGQFGDVLLSMPLILAAAFVLTLFEGRGVAHVVFALVVLGWPPMTLLVRAQVRSIRQAEFVSAAFVLGANRFRLLTKHILPNALWVLVVFATTYTAVAVTAEALLTFLGVGLDLPAISWGLMLAQARFRSIASPHLLIPAVFLSLTVACFVLVGEAIRRAFDPEA